GAGPCLRRGPARPASVSHGRLRGGVRKGGPRPAVGVLETEEVLVRAAMVGLTALGQEVEPPLRAPDIFFRWTAHAPTRIRSGSAAGFGITQPRCRSAIASNARLQRRRTPTRERKRQDSNLRWFPPPGSQPGTISLSDTLPVGGGRGIRTPKSFRTAVFKTAALRS